MHAMTPTLWLILGIACLLLIGSVFLYFKARHEAGQTLECRTADMSLIEQQSAQLQSKVPTPLPTKRARAGMPASYDADRTPDRRVADFAAFRASINQVEVTAAQHALLDMGRGVRRANPHAMGSVAFAPYQIAYERVWMEREHQNTESEVARA